MSRPYELLVFITYQKSYIMGEINGEYKWAMTDIQCFSSRAASWIYERRNEELIYLFVFQKHLHLHILKKYRNMQYCVSFSVVIKVILSKSIAILSWPVTTENQLSEEICDVPRESVMNFHLFHYNVDACKSFSESVEFWELISPKLRDSTNLSNETVR